MVKWRSRVTETPHTCKSHTGLQQCPKDTKYVTPLHVRSVMLPILCALKEENSEGRCFLEIVVYKKFQVLLFLFKVLILKTIEFCFGRLYI